jgi:hypothetical protein
MRKASSTARPSRRPGEGAGWRMAAASAMRNADRGFAALASARWAVGCATHWRWVRGPSGLEGAGLCGSSFASNWAWELVVWVGAIDRLVVLVA